jgi:hypothetical protein
MLYKILATYKISVSDELVTPDQKELIASFLDRAFLCKSQRKISILFRGENMADMLEKFKVQNEWEMRQLLFIIGEKGKIFRQRFNGGDFDSTRIQKIDDTSNEFFTVSSSYKCNFH